MPCFNPAQLTFARIRRQLSKKQLAAAVGVTVRSVQSYENGTTVPSDALQLQLAQTLRFPHGFFLLDEELPALREGMVSFRRASKTPQRLIDCAFASASLAFRVNDWLEAHFHLPATDLPDLSDLPPEEAAATLRRLWGMGNAPVSNMVHLLEAKGVRVFSLAEETREVDAFCTWHDSKPFIFLNTVKSAERSRFDAAHELAHLVRDLHTMRHQGGQNAQIENEANQFAAAFLMPEASVKANRPPVFHLQHLMPLKVYWGVSLAAVARRFFTLGLMSQWQYRELCIAIAKHGYRTNEPDPMPRETSQVFTKAFAHLRTRGKGVRTLAQELCLSLDEINALTFGLTPLSVLSGSGVTASKVKTPSATHSLRLLANPTCPTTFK